MALAGFQFLEITKSPFADPEPLKLVRCCLKRFGAEHVQKPRRVLIKTDIQNCRRVLLKGFRTWAHRLYDQTVSKTIRFRHDLIIQNAIEIIDSHSLGGLGQK